MSSNRALADDAPPVRPGVTNRTLRDNGITVTEPGPGDQWGLRIPYDTYDGSDVGRCPEFDESRPEEQFCRERLAKPRGKRKYSQPAGTRPHAYFPAGLAALSECNSFTVITEGEMKALALVEAGYPAIGLGGSRTSKRTAGYFPNYSNTWMQ